MRKKKLHFELVSVEEAEKVLKQQNRLAKRNGNRKLVVRKTGRTPGGRHTLSKKPEVSVA